MIRFYRVEHGAAELLLVVRIAGVTGGTGLTREHRPPGVTC